MLTVLMVNVDLPIRTSCTRVGYSFANYGISNVTEFPCMKKLIV